MHKATISMNEGSETNVFSPTSTLLTRTDTNEFGTFSGSKHFRSRYVCLGPTLLLLTSSVVLVTAGLGVSMVFWFAKHTSQDNLSAIWNSGAFLLDEGTHTEGGLEAAQLTGLTIASAASIATSVAMPILMSLYAYRASYVWMKAGKENLPTPLQYGLLIETMSAFGILSLFKTGRYFSTSSKKRRRIPYVLKEVFCVSLVSYILVHIVGALDLWLHVASLTFNVEVQIPVEPFNLSVVQEVCRPYNLETYDKLQADQVDDLDLWLYDNIPCGLPDDPDEVNGQRLLLALNNSEIMTINLLEAEQDLAVLVPTHVPENVAFVMNTFDARAACTPITNLCEISPLNPNGTSCGAAPSTFRCIFPSNTDFRSGFAGSVSYPIIEGFNASIYEQFEGVKLRKLLKYPVNTSNSGGYAITMQFWWPSSFSSFLDDSEVISGMDRSETTVMNCNFTYYNVSLGYQNGSYNTLDEEISERFLSDGFSGPLRANILTTILVDNLQHVFLSNVTDEDRMKAMAQELSRLAIASAGVSANTTGPTLRQTQIQTRILGRYPFVPVILLIAVLFINSLFALVICIATSVTHASFIRVPGKEGTKPVSLLDLARLRLVSPATLVADRFPLKGIVKLTRAELQVMLDTFDMFCEDTVGRRVGIGMHEDKESGEWVFGTWVEEADASP